MEYSASFPSPPCASIRIQLFRLINATRSKRTFGTCAVHFIICGIQTSRRSRSATVLLISVYEEVRRTTSPLQVSYPPGKLHFSPWTRAKRVSQRFASWVFSGRSGFLPQGKLTGWVGINTVKKLISQLL